MDAAKQQQELAELKIKETQLQQTIKDAAAALNDATAALKAANLRTAEIEQQMRLNTDEQSQITEISIGWDGNHE
jgi:septal ring factor EnvC (AmiA/AmiB activator)